MKRLHVKSIKALAWINKYMYWERWQAMYPYIAVDFRCGQRISEAMVEDGLTDKDCVFV